MPPRVDILGVWVDVQTIDTAVERIGGWVERREPNYVCVTGVHGVVESHDDPGLRRIHNEAGMVTTDGMPLVWLGRLAVRTRKAALPPRKSGGGDLGGVVGVERVYGPDLMLRTLERSETTGWRHFLLGSTAATLDRLNARIGERFPRVRVVGSHSPPFPGPGDSTSGDRATVTTAADSEVADQIAKARPDIVWVGLSTPEQERWMAEHVGRVRAPVLVGVGAAFDFLAGTKPQAPPWMQRSGLEWAFRLAHEPRRLAGRYLRNNPRFVWLLAKETLGKPAANWKHDHDHCP